MQRDTELLLSQLADAQSALLAAESASKSREQGLVGELESHKQRTKVAETELAAVRSQGKCLGLTIYVWSCVQGKQ